MRDAGACDAGDTNGSDTLLSVNFDKSPLGTYSESSLNTDWPGVLWSDGVQEGRVSIVDGFNAYSGRTLKVFYPQGTYGADTCGAQWLMKFPASHDELYLTYRIHFGEGFNFVKGGKLPGLSGGNHNAGGNRPTGKDGWSARMMWRAGGKVVQYVYHPDQPTMFGEDFPWDAGGQRYFMPGTWHIVEHRIVMNTPGQRNGRIQGWFDGWFALDRTGLRFRDVNSFAVEQLMFSTFFGGNGAEWASQRNEYIFFDNFVISTSPVAH